MKPFDPKSGPPPSIHFVLGSGLATVFEKAAVPTTHKLLGALPFSEMGFKSATAPGHPGKILFFENKENGTRVSFQLGRLHGYEGLAARAVVEPVMRMRELGVNNFFLTNAAGALNPKFVVGSVMLIKDHVNFTGDSPLYGPNPTRPNLTPWGPRFPDLSQTWDQSLSFIAKTSLMDAGLKVEEGIYLGLRGPQYETPAEVKLYSSWGLDAVGMSTVWEALALSHSGAKVLGASIISNMGCGLVPGLVLKHSEVEEVVARVAEQLVRALFSFSESV